MNLSQNLSQNQLFNQPQIPRKTKWNNEKIFVAFDNFIEQNGRLPKPEEIKMDKSLPSAQTVRKFFGLTIAEFYKKYYADHVHLCDSRKYHYNSTDYWIENFKEQYIRNNYPPQYKYDMLRDSKTPSSHNLIKISGQKTWINFLHFCGFDIEKIRYEASRPKMTIEDIDLPPEKYQKFYEALNKALKDIEEHRI